MTINRNDYLISRLGALCFFFSTIEYMIPKPLPFLRIGLANIPLMLAVDALPLGGYLALVAIKVLGQGLIGGTLFSYIFLFSAAGTLSSALVMLALRKTFRSSVSFVGVSVAGAFASNAAQLLLARVYIFGESARYIAPPFLAVGLLSGATLGFLVNRFARASRWFADVRAGLVPAQAGCGAMQPDATATASGIAARATAATAAVSATAEGQTGARFMPLRLAAGMALILVLMFAGSLAGMAPQALETPLALALEATLSATGIILLLSSGGRIKLMPAVSVSASIVIFNLMAPFGRVLLEPFGLPITDGALILGIKKALLVEGMIFISRWTLYPPPRLPGRAGSLLSEAFSFLGYLTSGKKRLDRRDLVAGIDAIMYGPD